MPAERILITAAAAALVVLWLFLAARGPGRKLAESGAIELRYSGPLRAFAWLTAIGMPALIILVMATVRVSNVSPWMPGGLMLALAFIGGFLLLETQRVRITLTDLGIHSVSAWRGPREIPWHRVQEVSFSLLHRWFIVKSQDGPVVRVSCFLVGIRTFAEKVKQHVPPERYVKATRGFGMI